RFGAVADLHYADRAPAMRRHYRESCLKLREAVALFNAQKVDFAVELGDFKDDSGGREATLGRLREVEREFARFDGPRYHVAGNHDFDCLSPEEFFAETPNDARVSAEGYYSFVRGGVRFVVLNACYDSALAPYSRCNPWTDANIPPREMEWLARELAAAEGHVVVFCHQRLDDSAEANHLVKNAAAVRALMAASGKVRLVVTGHQHCGGWNIQDGIPYYSLRAMVIDAAPDESSYATFDVYPSGGVRATGWRNALSARRPAGGGLSGERET
ncbi:MAG: metallophosphoesterase, partial [Kiritimatiellae bacterium]|nr:metallophosphoesterase [Kiritimatiellia bacterium]